MAIPANPDTSNSVGATDDASKGGLLNTGSDTILNGINNAIASNAEAAQTAATAAGTSATNAATSATNAAASATTASTKAGEAASSAGTATTQAGIATTQAGLATTNGAAQVTLATTQAGIATTQAGIATTQASLATTNGAAQVTLATAAKNDSVAAKDLSVTAKNDSVTAKNDSVTAKNDSVTAKDLSVTAKNDSVTAKTAAEAAQTAAEAAFDNFDDRYLGAKSSDPTVDNDGNALITGALYFNSTSNTMKVYTGSAWNAVGTPSASTVNPLIDAHLNQSTASSGELLSWNGSDYDWVSAGGGGDLLAANNLSDVANAATARTNLGLAIGSNVQAYSSVLTGTTASYTTALNTKLSGIEASADVTDTANVVSALTAGTGITIAGNGTIASTVSSGIASVAADTSPQLGGNLDVVTHDIVSTSNRNINILPNGSGKVNLDGNGSSGGVSVSDGLVDIRTGTGNRSQVKFYCEVSNAHAQTIQPQPHSASVTNTLTLPAGGNQELVGTTATQTLTNKSIAASQLTGALPAISGAALTNLPGGADLYAANESSPTAQPSATGANAIAIGDSAVASGANAVALGSSRAAGQYSFAAGIYDNSASYGARGNFCYAIGYRAGTGTSEQGSVAIGWESVATGSKALALGTSYASGSHGFSAAINNGTSPYGASGTNSVAIGNGAKATGSNSIAIGGQNNIASHHHAIAMGENSTASHINSVSIGDSVQSTATNQINLGGTADTVRISETYTLPTSDGSANQVLTTNGSGVVSFADAGGGGAALYAANESSPAAQPSATGTNAIAIGNSAVSSGTDSVAIGKDSVAAVSRAFAIGKSRSAGDNALAVGIYDNTASYGASGDQSFAQSDRAKASGQQSFSAGKQSTASGSNSVAIGRQASASSTSAMAFGYQATAQGTYNISMGREASTPSWASNSVALGTNCKTSAKGKISFGAQAGSIGLGMAQSGMLILHARTANSTSSVLTSDGGLQGVGTAAYNNQLYLESYAAMAFDGLIVARGQGNASNTDCAAFKIEGLIRRESNANTTVLVNSATTVINNAPGWGVTLSADTTNGALAVHVTGSSSANVKWVCTLRTSETIYDSY